MVAHWAGLGRAKGCPNPALNFSGLAGGCPCPGPGPEDSLLVNYLSLLLSHVTKLFLLSSCATLFNDFLPQLVGHVLSFFSIHILVIEGDHLMF